MVEWLTGRLERARAAGVSQNAFARSIGMSPTQLSRLLSGQRRPNWADVGRLSYHFPDACQSIREAWDKERAA